MRVVVMLNKRRMSFLLAVCTALVLHALRPVVIRAEQLPEVRELTYTWRGYQVYYRTAGDVERRSEGESAPPVIFLHGFGASSFAWRHNLAAVAEQHKVVAPDLLGFGKSDKPRIQYSPDVWANLVHEFSAAHGYQKVILVGNGLGGLVGAQCALKFPDKVDRLVLVDSLGLSYDLPRVQRFFTTPVLGKPAFRLFLKPGNVARVLRSGIYADPSKVTDEVAEGYYRPFLSPGAIDAYRYVGRRIFQWKLGERFKEIGIPTLIVWGEDDRITSIEDAVELDGLIPNSTIVAIPGAGHCPQEESPEQFNELLIRYLKRPGSVAAAD